MVISYLRPFQLRRGVKRFLCFGVGGLLMVLILASLTTKQDLSRDISERFSNAKSDLNKDKQDLAHGNEELILDVKTELNKDIYHVVTAASSEEFGSLLKLIDSLQEHARGFDLLVWSLDLRACELNYLLNLKTPFKLSMNEFPFHFHPLHVRSAHMNAYRPIILEIGVQSLGQILWIDPTCVVSNDPLPLIGKLTDEGFIISAVDKTAGCSSKVVGFGLSPSYDKVLKPWVNCAKKQSCILPVTEIARGKRDEDPYLDGLVKQAKFECTPTSSVKRQASFNGSHFPTFARWKASEKALCTPHKGCILTGSHQSFDCVTPQLPRLRQNKEKYARYHGYAYLEETHGFHRHSPCNRVWNKVHAILKYLGDCEILLWIDTDAVFTNIGKSLSSFFEQEKGMELLISRPISDRILNAGVLLMRGTKSMRDFFVNVTNGKAWKSNWCSEWTLEQSAINDQLQSGSLNGKYVIKHDDRFLQSLCGYNNGQCKWTKDDFIAHFAPPACPQLVDIVRDFLDKYPQFTRG